MKKFIVAIKEYFKRDKSIAFIDGDQPIPPLLEVYNKYLKNTETHFVRAILSDANPPKALKKTGFNKIYLRDLSAGKECTDKFIAAFIQKSLQEGYTNITVVSSDYDFVDIFKMAAQLNPNAKVSFRLIVPRAEGKLKEIPNKFMNIEIVKE